VALAAAEQTAATHEYSAIEMFATAGLHLRPGDRISLTGDMKLDRREWEGRARSVGLQPAGIAKSTKVLVAADPNSLSGKASKAQSYGIPIITEEAF
jgi:DNA polymerase-3 subunit epsilon